MLKRIIGLIMSIAIITTMAATILSSPVAAQDNEIPQSAFDGVGSNDDWEPYVREFDGVEMVLVPVGCFMMGITEDQIDEIILLAGPSYSRRNFLREKPVQEQCFDQPFWIDKYEITNVQFEALDGEAASESRWTEDARPRETINWFEASDYCDHRDARLPTEAEWEYAARGPDNLIFPWGNTFDPENVVFQENAQDKTAEVGSKPDGASWVGALDMSGNVGEWTSSIVEPYPYDATDGREDDTDEGAERVIRGGSYNQAGVSMRATDRIRYTPRAKGYLHGARCVRPFEEVTSETP